jgi:hypothetical protein
MLFLCYFNENRDCVLVLILNVWSVNFFRLLIRTVLHMFLQFIVLNCLLSKSQFHLEIFVMFLSCYWNLDHNYCRCLFQM